MIPRLAQVEPAQGRYLAFLETLGRQGFQGEIRSDYGTRLVQSTDNSIYQILPQAAVFPINKSDLKILLKLAAHEKYRDCLLYTSPSPRDKRQSRMPSSA